MRLKHISKKYDVMTEASFRSWNIAHSKHSYSDCEFVKKNITDVVAVLDLNNKKLQRLIVQMPCLHQTTQRGSSQKSVDIVVTMQSDLKSCLAFSIAIH